ncbi:X-ray repair cross-complementing protein 5 [Tupaia chinensis]|uniref:X-ray repair cross-complementing protein 5 n=1 Tax=Tupaia chinensis TaxID=246437 RepID=L9L8P9_TUPCH|nr:X-ray repair cross-complementing protein 5 [Tupaia chinensis]
MDRIKAFREAIEFPEEQYFYSFLKRLREKVEIKQLNHFWEIVVRDGITLISKDEASGSSVTEEEARKFWPPKKNQREMQQPHLRKVVTRTIYRIGCRSWLRTTGRCGKSGTDADQRQRERVGFCKAQQNGSGISPDSALSPPDRATCSGVCVGTEGVTEQAGRGRWDDRGAHWSLTSMESCP